MRRPLSDKAYAALFAASGTHVASLAGLSQYDHRCDHRVVKPLVAGGYMKLEGTPLGSWYYKLTPTGTALFEAERAERSERRARAEAGR